MSLLSFFTNLFKSSSSNTRFPNVVVGQITSIEAHPNADRLRVTKVNIGRELNIVCGAPNIEIGQFVPVALIGATLANGMIIKQAAIRGVDSEGMICAADELGLGGDHSGIMVFENARIGDPIDNYLKN